MFRLEGHKWCRTDIHIFSSLAANFTQLGAGMEAHPLLKICIMLLVYTYFPSIAFEVCQMLLSSAWEVPIQVRDLSMTVLYDRPFLTRNSGHCLSQTKKPLPENLAKIGLPWRGGPKDWNLAIPCLIIIL